VQQDNFFSEKLIDALLCECVPIYWGCPNIGEFMDTSGMIICKDEAELRSAILAASPEGYQRRLPALRAIKEVAAGYAQLDLCAAQALSDSL